MKLGFHTRPQKPRDGRCSATIPTFLLEKFQEEPRTRFQCFLGRTGRRICRKFMPRSETTNGAARRETLNSLRRAIQH